MDHDRIDQIDREQRLSILEDVLREVDPREDVPFDLDFYSNDAVIDRTILIRLIALLIDEVRGLRDDVQALERR